MKSFQQVSLNSWETSVHGGKKRCFKPLNRLQPGRPSTLQLWKQSRQRKL